MTDFITPGTTFNDDRGAIAQLHGIGVQQVGDRWFAWGEDKTNGDRFTAVSCYSTADFAEWRYEGDALTAGDDDLASDRIVERPKVLQRPDGLWVMFLHIDSADYADARLGYAISESPAGPFRFVGSERPLGNLSRDIGVYQEHGVGYILSEDRNNGLHILRLRDDYLGIAQLVTTLRQQDRPAFGYESPTMVRHGDTYYLFGSDLTGWSMNENKYATATDLAGPWTPWRNVAPGGTRTFDSQVSVVVPVGAGYVYIGDRWNPDDLFRSPAVVLPLLIANGTAELVWREQWQVAELFQ